ncbi:hypothetical protein [Methanolobus sp. WCC5]|jgi:hypothetical protein|uniref:hypothetical protein n=1 Tax=Methanolobus sp. WCC5 TaxID=3125785 RepID=UPI0032560C87
MAEKTIDRDQLVQTGNLDSTDFVVEEDYTWDYTWDYPQEEAFATETPGFNIMMALLAFIAVIYISRRRLQ